MGAGDFVAASGLDGVVVPVCVIDLQLHEFHFRMGVQKLLQFVRRGMEREADMLENAFRFLGLNPVPKAEIIEEMGAVFA